MHFFYRFSKRIQLGLFSLAFLCLQASQLSAEQEVYTHQYIVEYEEVAAVGNHGVLDYSDPLEAVATVTQGKSGVRLLEFQVAALDADPKEAERKPYSADEAKATCDFIRSIRPVKYCEPNLHWTINATPNDPLFSELYGLQKMNLPAAWDTQRGDTEVIVAVTDTGIDYQHPDLTANMWRNPGEIPGNGVDDDGNGYIDDIYGIDSFNNDSDPQDDHGHGTHCAGTIGGSGNNGTGLSGVNWNVRLMALKFLGARGGGSTLDAIELIDYAIENGASVINASWGGTIYSQALENAISRANDAGVLFVAAAGNSGLNTDMVAHYPAGYDFPNVISVAATDSNDNLASFSNYGPLSTHVAAPGRDILSTFPGGKYVRLSGTSMAAPHVAGLAALLRSQFPQAPVDEIFMRILNGDSTAELSSKLYSGVRVNAFRALTQQPANSRPGPEPGLNDVSVSQFSSLARKRRKNIYRNKAFQLEIQGTPGSVFSGQLGLHGVTEFSCQLGSFRVPDSGRLKLKGRLRLYGVLRYVSKTASVELNSDETTRVEKRLRRLKKEDQGRWRRQRKRALRELRDENTTHDEIDSIITCSLIKNSLKIVSP